MTLFWPILITLLWATVALFLDDWLLDYDPSGPPLLRAVFVLAWPLTLSIALVWEVIDRLRK